MPGYLVGRGIADITGEAADCGMLGYGKRSQRSAGIHLRLRARAFVFCHDDSRVLLVVSELPLMFDSVHRAVLARLSARFGALYTARNTLLTVTHTHSGPGGYSHHRLYNLTVPGFRPKTFEAVVTGIVAAAQRAHADLAPAELSLAHGELHGASVNRSRAAWLRNPAADRSVFPAAVDPQTTLLRIERAGRLVGAVNFFGTHGTSMCNENRLISGDNKGYAAYHWERRVAGVDYLTGEPPGFVGAFAQTNAGDMSPNLNLRPRSGPTEDEFANTREIGLRQYRAAAELAGAAGVPLGSGVDARLTYVDLGAVEVRPEFTGDGRAHRTGPPVVGAACLAGTDEGRGFPGFRQGRGSVLDVLSRVWYRWSARLRDAQSPKGIAFAARLVRPAGRVVQERYPVQLLRIGRLHLIGIPGEVTITAGLRLRRVVAGVLRMPLADVLVVGYSNGYFHYVTTPEEYGAQRYEGGSTLFGRWQLGALCQVVSELAEALRDGVPVALGLPPPDLSRVVRGFRWRAVDHGIAGREFGEVVLGPRAVYLPGETARAVFLGAHLGNSLRREGTFLQVQQRIDGVWVRVADDGDWATRLRWERRGGVSLVTVSWDVPVGTAGVFRLCYQGDLRAGVGRGRPISGVTREFSVRG